MRKYEDVNIEDLKPYENNARTHSEEQVNKIANSIKEFGFINPVLIDENKIIIAGHGRVLGAKQLGMKQVPCIYVEDLTETQKRAYILADNKLALDAGWDDAILKGELKFLQDNNFDISIAGFSIDEIDINATPIEFVEDEYTPEPPKEPKAKLGDIYKLGQHRLMCGNSTDINDVAKLMNGKAIDLIVTDPPYNVMIVGGSHALPPERRAKAGEKMIMNDNMDDLEFYNFLADAFNIMAQFIKDGGGVLYLACRQQRRNF